MMERTLVIDEKYPVYWFRLTVVLALFTIVMIGLYSGTEDVLWKGYLRLIAFAGFAATVLVTLKMMMGKHSVILKKNEGQILLFYYRKSEKVSEDRFELDKISSLRIGRSFKSGWGGDLFFRDMNVIVELENIEQPFNLLEMDGYPLNLDRESADRVVNFITGSTLDIEPESE